MATNKIQIEDHNGDIYYPHTSADVVKRGTSTVDADLKAVENKFNAQGAALGAVQLTTPRTINGTSFNGTANITTTKWGTARNLVLGKATKPVDGSANISYTLDEMGAVKFSYPGSGVLDYPMISADDAEWLKMPINGIVSYAPRSGYLGHPQQGFYDTNTAHINGYQVGGASGRRWGVVPTVAQNDGVMDIGQGLDFHRSNTNTTDYNGRILFDTANTFWISNSLMPGSQDNLEIGSSTRRWRSAYFSGNVNAASHVNNSERRLKTNIKEFSNEDAYEGIKNLPIYTYSYKKDLSSGLEIVLNEDGEVVTPSTLEESHEFDPHISMGIMVDEAPKEVVSNDETGVDIYAFASYIASALKRAISKIEILEKEIKSLKSALK